MNGEIHLHDVVVLTEDVPTRHFESGRPLLLRRGQVGTAVMTRLLFICLFGNANALRAQGD